MNQTSKSLLKPDMSVSIAGVTFKNPVLTASGTFGSGIEYAEMIDLSELGGLVTKGVSNVPWPGNPTPRVTEVSAGMLNAIGLQNPGAVDMLEINVSCPNVKEGAIAFGQNPDMLYDITRRIKSEAAQPVIMKLTPNVTDITVMAKAAEAGGADAISLINTITGAKIDIERRQFVLANKTGGLSGPAIKPVAVRMVWQASHAVSIPVIGMGGIATAEDAIEFMMAGASAVAVGAMNFHDPCTTVKVARGMEAWCASHGVERAASLTGIV